MNKWLEGASKRLVATKPIIITKKSRSRNKHLRRCNLNKKKIAAKTQRSNRNRGNSRKLSLQTEIVYWVLRKKN